MTRKKIPAPKKVGTSLAVVPPKPVAPPVERRCGTCGWWDSIYREKEYAHMKGTCRRYAPRLADFPQTRNESWCGDYTWDGNVPLKPKPKPKPKRVHRRGYSVWSTY